MIFDIYLFGRFGFTDEEYLEFSKTVQDKIIGTKGEVATVSTFFLD